MSEDTWNGEERRKKKVFARVGPGQIILYGVTVLIFLILGGAILREENRISDLIDAQSLSRQGTTNAVCQAINGINDVSRQQTYVLQQIVIGGAKSSKPFEKTYREFGLPPYKDRLATAHQQADLIGSKAAPLLNCEKLNDVVRAAAMGKVLHVPLLEPAPPVNKNKSP